MAMGGEAGRFIRQGVRVKGCPHAIHLFVRRSLFIQSYYNLLLSPGQKFSHKGAEILLLFWLEVLMCWTLHATVHSPSPVARIGSSQTLQLSSLAQMKREKKELHFHGNTESCPLQCESIQHCFLSSYATSSYATEQAALHSL